MFAPRRIGKTWLMKNYLLNDAKNKEFNVVYCDLQANHDCEGAILEIIEKIQQIQTTDINLLSILAAKFKKQLGKGSFNSFTEIMKETGWQDLFEATIDALTAPAQDKPWLILLDEVTVCAAHMMQQNPAEGRLFLSTLIKIREQFPRVCWMLTGSIGIDFLIKEYNVSGAFKDLKPFLIEPFSTAIAVVAELKPIQAKVAEYAAQPELVRSIIAEGSEKMRDIARQILDEVCYHIELNYR